MQQGLGFIHVINARTCMEVQHLQVEMVSIVCGVYRHSMCGPMKDNHVTSCDYSASCSIIPAFRMCTHHYTTCVGIPIFRHQLY